MTFRLACGTALAAALVAGHARSCTTLPSNLANGQTADASQVMADFNGIVNCPQFSGNIGVGLGSASPVVPLDVNGDGLIRGGILFMNSSSGPSYPQMYIATWQNAFVIDESNNQSWVATMLTVDIHGNTWIAGALTQNSDATLKTDIRPITDALERVTEISGVTFRWKDPTENARTQIGVTAQDVEKVFPEAVSKGPEGYMAVNYSGLIAPLIEAVKELKTLSDNERAEIARLQTASAQESARADAAARQVAELRREFAASARHTKQRPN